MGRKAKPWFRKHDDYWYATITPGAKPEKLVKGQGNEGEAQERFQELTRRGRCPYDTRSTEIVVSLFLEHVQQDRKPRTYDNYSDLLSAFCKHYGSVKVKDLTDDHARAFIHRQESKKRRKVKYTAKIKSGRFKGIERNFVATVKPWSPNRSATFAAVIRSCFNWAVKTKKITSHPFHHLDRPYKATRTRIYSAEEFTSLVETTDKDFGDFLTALRLTGCRPSELSRVTAKDVDTKNWCFILEEHKTDRTGADKVIWLNDEMILLTQARMNTYPNGSLFCNSRGNAWNRSTISHKFRKLRNKLEMDESAVPYAARHTFITEALTNDVPIATVAELVGHGTTRMIETRYGHLSQKKDYLRSAIKKATRNSS